MKQKETLSTTPLKEQHIDLSNLLIEEMGDEHKASSVETPLRADAFDTTDEEKIAAIAPHFKAIMEILGMDLRDDSLKGTPVRVAKMYVKELFQGLNPANMPSMTLFENKFQYNEMLVEKNINFYTNCEHHFVPFFGKAHVAYISSGKVIGLSKLNRLVEYFSKLCLSSSLLRLTLDFDDGDDFLLLSLNLSSSYLGCLGLLLIVG